MSDTKVPVTLYIRGWCSYCAAAKALLAKKGATFEEIDIEAVPGARAEMLEKAAGRTSVPQIFIGDMHVGGYDEMASLERQGRLDQILSGGV